MTPDAPLPPIPIGLLFVLEKARAEPQFLEALVSGRSFHARLAGFQLSSSEQAMLDAVPAPQLRAMVASLPGGRPAPPVTSRPMHDFPAPGGCAADLPDKLKK